MSRLNFPKDRVLRYVRFFQAIVKDSLLRFYKMTAAILLAGFGSLAAQIGAILISASYANLLDKGTSFELLGVSFDPRSSRELMVVCAAGVLVTLLLSAFLKYFSGVQTVKLRRTYQEFSSLRVFQLVQTRPLVWIPTDRRLVGLAALQRLARGDSGYNGRALQLLLRAIVPAVSTILAFGVLLHLEALSTVGILLVLAISTTFLYRSSRWASDASLAMEKSAAAASRSFRRHLRQLQPKAPIDSKGSPLGSDEILGGDVRVYMNSRDHRFLAVESSSLASNIFLSAILFLIILTLGATILQKGTGWGRLLVYLVALRHGLFSLRALSTTLTSINRFYPQILRYRRFIENNRRLTLSPSRFTVSVTSENPITNSSSEVHLSPGSVVAVIAPIALDRYTAGTILECLFPTEQEQALGLIGSSGLALVQPLAPRASDLQGKPDKVVEFSSQFSDKTLEDLLEGEDLLAEFHDTFPEELRSSGRLEPLENGSPNLRTVIAILSSCWEGQRALVVDRKSFYGLPRAVRLRLLSLLDDRILLLHSTEPDEQAELEETQAVVATRGEVIGVGDASWLRAQASPIQASLREAVAIPSAEGDLESNDDEEDLES